MIVRLDGLSPVQIHSMLPVVLSVHDSLGYPLPAQSCVLDDVKMTGVNGAGMAPAVPASANRSPPAASSAPQALRIFMCRSFLRYATLNRD